MTIACCYVVPEGIVLGADSTITTMIDGKPHYLNHNQKIFEVGEEGKGRFGIVTWGLTSFGNVSFRTLIGLLGDKLAEKEPLSVLDAANIWSNLVWEVYKVAFKYEIDRFRQIEHAIKTSLEPVTKYEIKNENKIKDELNDIFNRIRVGFCIAGYVDRDRMPHAYEIEFDPTLRSQAQPKSITRLKHFGNDNIVSRIVGVFDNEIKSSIINSRFWNGDLQDLENILANVKLERNDMTIRDALDFVYFAIYSTIKATKFSTHDKDCGGPIELAVITTDRKFRWVKHKNWDSAISDWNP